MSYETDSLKKDIKNLEYDLTRKVSSEEFRRNINDLESRTSSLESKINYIEQDLNNQLQQLREKLDSVIEYNNLTYNVT